MEQHAVRSLSSLLQFKKKTCPAMTCMCIYIYTAGPCFHPPLKNEREKKKESFACSCCSARIWPANGNYAAKARADRPHLPSKLYMVVVVVLRLLLLHSLRCSRAAATTTPGSVSNIYKHGGGGRGNWLQIDIYSNPFHFYIRENIMRTLHDYYTVPARARVSVTSFPQNM